MPSVNEFPVFKLLVRVIGTATLTRTAQRHNDTSPFTAHAASPCNAMDTSVRDTWGQCAEAQLAA